jgi:hypothetical protein
MKKQIILILSNGGKSSARKFAPGKNAKSNAIILVGVIVHQVVGTINWPDDIQGRKDLGDTIVEKCNTSTYVTFGTGVVHNFEDTVTPYKAADTDSRPSKFITMNNGAQVLLSIVKPIADASPALAAAIYHSCGFGLKDFHGSTVKEFSGEPGLVEGSVDLVTAGGPQDKDHLNLWYFSEDGIKFTLWGATNKQKTTLTGLPKGTYGYFMTQLSVQDVLKGLSQIIKVMAK